MCLFRVICFNLYYFNIRKQENFERNQSEKQINKVLKIVSKCEKGEGGVEKSPLPLQPFMR